MKLFIMLVVLPSLNFAQFLGPADVTIKRSEKCFNDRLGVESNIIMHKINRTHMGIDFDLKLPFPWDEKTDINVTVLKWGDGGWRAVYKEYKKNACEFSMQLAKEKIKELFRLMNHPESCPFAAGNYSVKKYLFDGQVEIPLLYGEFKAEFTWINDNVPFFCCRLFIDTTPKNAFG